jgi:DNA invertase Pin-like site-specific DNA recombinase
MGKFYFHMAAALAELERDRLIERTNAGLAAAKARGRKGGRKRALSAEQAALALDMMKDGGRSMAQVAKLMNVSRSTISRLVERAGGEVKVAVAAE